MTIVEANVKLPDKIPLAKWWAEARETLHPDDIIKVLITNKDRLEDALARLDGRKRLYNATNRMFSLISRLAEAADRLSVRLQRVMMRSSWFRGVIEKGREWKNHLNFKELTEFTRTKLYSLRLPPHNETAIRVMEEIMDFSARHGLDLSVHIPEARQRLAEKKHQLLQHKFFQEFSKTRLEQLLAIPFAFDRSIFPVLPDSAFWHRFFENAERKHVTDIFLVDGAGNRVSFRRSPPDTIAATEVVRILERLSAIKRTGRRIFFVGHHEGYLGPYFVRSVIRKLGFHHLAKNCNTVVGPRMFSNVVIRNGAANVGNLFVTVPSQKTTAIRTEGLAEALRKTARRTQCLIKMPEAGLRLVQNLGYEDFMKAFVRGDTDAFQQCTAWLDENQMAELTGFLETETFSEAMADLHPEDYRLFQSVMRECFLIFPEGSRSYTDPDGAVVLKYVNPKYMQAYMRPGDVIAPVNLVGGSDITRGWHLRSAALGLSMAEPLEVTPEMLANYEEEALGVMRTIAGLPNIKPVRLKDDIQFGRQAA